MKSNSCPTVDPIFVVREALVARYHFIIHQLEKKWLELHNPGFKCSGDPYSTCTMILGVKSFFPLYLYISLGLLNLGTFFLKIHPCFSLFCYSIGLFTDNVLETFNPILGR